MRRKNKRGRPPTLTAEQRAELLRRHFVKRQKQANLAMDFRISQSTVSRYIASAPG